jgi:fido (protein-threonine AMPylation protein)
MFGDVWDWAGKIRTAELNFGINAYLVSTSQNLNKLDMLSDRFKSYEIFYDRTRKG